MRLVQIYSKLIISSNCALNMYDIATCARYRIIVLHDRKEFFMKVTYISHSGFAVELPSATLLFDYYKGQIPDFPTDKPLFVFSSHSHGDHFVPQVFDLAKRYPQIHYIFSHDIWMMRKNLLMNYNHSYLVLKRNC